MRLPNATCCCEQEVGYLRLTNRLSFLLMESRRRRFGGEQHSLGKLIGVVAAHSFREYDGQSYGHFGLIVSALINNTSTVGRQAAPSSPQTITAKTT